MYRAGTPGRAPRRDGAAASPEQAAGLGGDDGAAEQDQHQLAVGAPAQRVGQQVGGSGGEEHHRQLDDAA